MISNAYVIVGYCVNIIILNYVYIMCHIICIYIMHHCANQIMIWDYSKSNYASIKNTGPWKILVKLQKNNCRKTNINFSLQYRAPVLAVYHLKPVVNLNLVIYILYLNSI